MFTTKKVMGWGANGLVVDKVGIFDEDDEQIAVFEEGFEEEAAKVLEGLNKTQETVKRTILKRQPDLNKYVNPEGIGTLDILAGVAGNLLEVLTWHKSNGKQWPLDKDGEDDREYQAFCRRQPKDD